jgi:hypothetical protein
MFLHIVGYVERVQTVHANQQNVFNVVAGVGLERSEKKQGRGRDL